MKAKHILPAAMLVLTAVNGAAQDVKYKMEVQLTDGTTWSVPTARVEQVKFVAEENTDPENLTFDITFNHLSLMEGTIDIRPSDKNATYCWGLRSRENYDKALETSGSITNLDEAWWWQMVDWYGGDWLDFMQESLLQGDQTMAQEDEEPFMRWNTEYVAYAYGRNMDGDVTSDVFTQSFTTPAPTPSDNQISVEVNFAYAKGVNATITTTNDDPYFVSLQRKTYVEWFQSRDLLDDMQFNLCKDQYLNPRMLRQGDTTITLDDFSYCGSDVDYYIIIFGYDNGPSTPLQLIPFHTLAE